MSSKAQVPNHPCPNCGGPVAWAEHPEHRPFCSQRCRDADFCDWANESHVISGDRSHTGIFSEDIEK